MKEKLDISLQQRQQMALAPLQLRYAKMLEMSGPEVEEEVARELDDNPALEAVDNEIPAYRFRTSNHSPDDDRPEPQIEADTPSLAEQLTQQLGEFDLTDLQWVIARVVIGNIDDNGYLRRDPQAMADDIFTATGIEVEREDVKAVVDIVRGLEPAGVGAYDLRDCLLLQLRRKSPKGPWRLAREIVTHYFDLFSKLHFDSLASATGASEEELRGAVEAIRSLNPKPGGSVGSHAERGIVPDFGLSVDLSTGDVSLSMLNNIPELQIAETFRPEASAAVDAPSMEFIKRKHDEANDFIKVLSMRQSTLFRIMKAIVRLQHDFFLTDDPADLHPMILKDVADITGDDLSVISRATAGKYVATAYGVYPLKFFFNERPKADNDDLSQHKVLQALREAIETEDKRRPLSDDALTKMLNDKGFDIARRTVAKYRERLGLPVARLRKKL